MLILMKFSINLALKDMLTHFFSQAISNKPPQKLHINVAEQISQISMILRNRKLKFLEKMTTMTVIEQ